jgi:hypothetical protein
MPGKAESAKDKIPKRKGGRKKPKKSNGTFREIQRKETQAQRWKKSTTNDYISPRWGAAVLRPSRKSRTSMSACATG